MRTQFMCTRLWQAMLGLSLLSSVPLHAASFVYEGQLDDRGAPANGRYDIQLAVYRDVELGATLSSPVVFNAVEVVDGRFRLDFDAKLDDGQAAWVELAVRDAGGSSFSAIPGRTKATQEPTAIGACWSSVGDSGSNPATNFLGTTDAQAFVIRTRDAQSLRIEPSAELSGNGPVSANMIAGSYVNSVTSGVRGATISGGGAPTIGDPGYPFAGPNRVTEHYGSVGGGFNNQAGNDLPSGIGAFATVGGGRRNTASGLHSVVGGGDLNTSTATSSAVVGGEGNKASGFWATVAGGYFNEAGGDYSNVGGGKANFASAPYATVDGGADNTASGAYAVVGGGAQNCAGGQFSMAVGTRAKVRPGSGSGNAGLGCNGVPLSGDGGGDSATFVWADNQGTEFTSTGDNQFLVRATGGMALNGPPIDAGVEFSAIADNDGPNYANLFLRQRDFNAGVLFSAGDATSTAANNAAFFIDQFNATTQTRRLTLEGDGDLVVTAAAFKPGGGAWSAFSDARLKTAVETLTGALDRLLALRGTTFEYRADATPKSMYLPGQQIGFIAQEVEAVFPQWVGQTADGFKTVGPQGFEALTVEALRELRNEGTLIDAAQADDIHSLKVRNKALEDEAAKLRASDQAIRSELAELRTLIEAQPTGDR